MLLYEELSTIATRIPSFQAMETKTAEVQSRSPTNTSSSSTFPITVTSPKLSQPDPYRSRHMKTDLDNLCHCYYHCYRYYHCYCYNLGCYYLGLCYPDCIRQSKLKTSSSCYSHVLVDIGLDSIQSLSCALTRADFRNKISLSLDVYSSPVREKKGLSEFVFSFEWIDLLGKNW